MTELPYKEILLLVLGSLSTYLIWRVQYQKDRLKTIESQLSEKKYKMYSEVIHIFFDMSKKNGVDFEFPLDDIVNRIGNIKKDMFLYAPDNIFLKFKDWAVCVTSGNGSHFHIYYELISLIRREFGYKNTKISFDEFMIFYMQNPEEYEKLKKLMNWQ